MRISLSGCSIHAKGCWCSHSQLSKSSFKVDMPSSQCYSACMLLGFFIPLNPIQMLWTLLQLPFTCLHRFGYSLGWCRDRWSLCPDDTPACELSKYWLCCIYLFLLFATHIFFSGHLFTSINSLLWESSPFSLALPFDKER